MSTPERVRTLIEPLVADLGLELYDLDFAGGVLRVVVTDQGGVGMDAITALTRSVSRALDDADPIPGGFTLEVSSPGLERTLRVPAHFQGAMGEAVSIKTVPGVEGARRFTGVVRAADDAAVTVELDEPAGEQRRVAYADIERARTVFAWGPAPKPGKAPKSKRAVPPEPSSPPTEEKVPAS